MRRAFSYPHPVVGNQDDVRSDFGLQLCVEIADYVRLKGQYSLDNATLRDLIVAERAHFVARANCRNTYFRKSIKVSDDQFSYSVELGRLRGQVVVEPMIVASKPIDDFRPVNLNEEYGDDVFMVLPGQLLAVGPELRFEVDTDFDPLRSPVGSIIQIADGAPDRAPFECDFEADRILVRISTNSWPQYQAIKGPAPHTIVSVIALPVLAEAMNRLRRDGAEESYGEYTWFQRLERICVERDIGSTVDSLRAAQQLLDTPYQRTFSELDAELHADGEE